MTFVESMLEQLQGSILKRQKHQNTFGYVWLCDVLTKCHSSYFADHIQSKQHRFRCQQPWKQRNRADFPSATSPGFHQRCGTQIGKPPPVRYVLRMTERSKGLENPSLME